MVSASSPQESSKSSSWVMLDTQVLCSSLYLPGDTVVKNLPANTGDAGDMDLILGLGRSPGVGNGNSLQYSCLENFMDRGA